MEKYIRAVGFALGLAAVIFLSSFNALFMTPNTEWFSGLNKPPTEPLILSLAWLISYLLTAVTIGEFISDKHIVKFSFLPAAFILLNVLWCFLFFRMHELISSCIVFVAIIAVESVMLFIMIKRTKFVFLCAVVNLLWYFYIFGLFVYILVKNN